MEEQKAKSSDIELRSEKVRNIIGQIPPFLVRSGMGVIAVVVVLALAVCYFIPYYETAEGSVEILSIPGSVICVSPSHGTVHFEIEGNESAVNRGDTIGYIRTADSIIRLTADISGKLSLNVKQDETIVAGETIYAITPNPISGVYGRVLLPYEYKAKIIEGQQVRIELAGFPSNEYGTLQGVVGEIYPLVVADMGNAAFPDARNSEYGLLKVDVDLPDGLTTSSQVELTFTPGMYGTVTVIISKQRLLLTLF
jgi:hypothetical protein